MDQIEEVTDTLSTAGFLSAKEEVVQLVQAASDDTDKLNEMLHRRLTSEPLGWITGPDFIHAVVPQQIAPGAVQQQDPQSIWFRGDHRHGYSGGPIVDLQGRVVGMTETGFFYANGALVQRVGRR